MSFVNKIFWFFKKEVWLWWGSPAHFIMPFMFVSVVMTLMGIVWENPVSHQTFLASVWLTLLFAGVLRFIKGSDPESESGIFFIFKMTPHSAFPFFVSKFVMNLVYLLLLLLLSVGLFVVFHPIYRLVELLGFVWLPLGLWLIGFCLLGTVFSGMLLGYDRRDASLALLLYPFLIPASVALLKCFEVTSNGYFISVNLNWIYFLALFDGIFLMVSLYVQETLFE